MYKYSFLYIIYYVSIQKKENSDGGVYVNEYRKYTIFSNPI